MCRRDPSRGRHRPLNGTDLHKTAADCAEGLPGAALEHPFGPDWEVFKVRGKVFMLMTEVQGSPRRAPQGCPLRKTKWETKQAACRWWSPVSGGARS